MNLERYKLDIVNRDGNVLQCVSDPKGGSITWQIWKRGRHLGHGAHGEVRQEVWEDENGDMHYRAVKICSQSRMEAIRIDYKREILALAAFSKSEYSGFFVDLHGWWIDSGNLFVAMEYLGFGNLSNYVSNEIPEAEIKEIAHDILSGLEIMHGEGFTHRDIKPQNILVYRKPPESPRWRVKIADFGISKQTLEGSETGLHTTVGTPTYCAPEILRLVERLEDRSVYDSKVDMWSFGCVLFNIASRGQLPFPGPDLLKYCIGMIKYNHRDITLHLSNDGQALVGALLQVEPAMRLTATETLRQPWFMTATTTIDSLTNSLEVSHKPSPKGHPNFDSFRDSTMLTNSLSSSRVVNLVVHTRPSSPTEEVTSMNAAGLVPLETANQSDKATESSKKSVHFPMEETKAQIKQQALDAAVRNSRAGTKALVNGPHSSEPALNIAPKKSSSDVSTANATEQLDSLNLNEILRLEMKQEYFRESSNDSSLTLVHLAAYEGNLQAVWSLIERGDDVTEKNGRGQSPLHLAALNGNISIMDLLVQHGAKIDELDWYRLSPLFIAVGEGHIGVVEWLVQEGASLHDKHWSGWTLLHKAAERGRLNMVRWLLDHGANVHAKSNDGRTSLHLAAEYGHLDVVECLRAEGADIFAEDRGSSILQSAASNNNWEVVRWYVKQRADWAKRDSHNRPLLHKAVQHGRLDIVKWLVALGADIHETARVLPWHRKKSSSPLHVNTLAVAWRYGRSDIVEWIEHEISGRG